MASHFDRGGRTDGSTGSGHLIPVPADARPTGLTYEPFYGLREKPFSLTSDSRFFYQSRSHAPAFDDLLNAIRRRESLNVLTGDIGTGKTTLCRAVLQSLDRKTFSAFVPDPFASREDLLKVLLTDFGVASINDVTGGRLRDATRTELSYLLYDFLATLVPLQAFAVAIIDEAQNLSQQLLEEVRILSDADGQLQIVLVGQLELHDKLRLPEMRQLDQRVSVHCQLQPLDCAGVAGYVSHRLRVAGGSPDRVRFTGDAAEAIYELSGGVPRIVNRICDRSLHHAYTKREASIDAAHVMEANEVSRPALAAVPTTPVIPPVVVAVAPPAAVPPEVTSNPSIEAFLEDLNVLSVLVEETAPRVAAAPVLPAATAPAEPLPARLEIWLSKIESESGPIEGDWRRRWAPTNAVAAPSLERRSGVRVKIPTALPPRPVTKVAPVRQRWSRRLVTLVVLVIIAIGVAVRAPATVAAWVEIRSEIDYRLTPPRMPDLPASPVPHLAAPAHVAPPADPLGMADAPADLPR